MTPATPKGWNFLSVDGELSKGKQCSNHKMDKICTLREYPKVQKLKNHSPMYNNGKLEG
jgi:hypothetical protein